MKENEIENIIQLILESPLDQTIKDILVRDLKESGMTDFLREQIKAYCMDGISELNDKISQAKKFLAAEEQTPPM